MKAGHETKDKGGLIQLLGVSTLSLTTTQQMRETIVQGAIVLQERSPEMVTTS